MLSELHLMHRLHELDIDIHRLETELASLQTQCDQHTKDQARRAVLLAKLQSQLEQTTSKRQQAETHLKQHEDKLAKFRKQADFIKTPKELEAVNHQVAQAEADVSRVEEVILAAMEEEEKTSHDLSEKKAAASKMDAKAQEFVSRAKDSITEKKNLLKGLREDRITIGNQFPGDLLSSYEYLKRKYPENVLVPLAGGACGGCGGILIPNLVIDVKLGQKMLQCNHCERYLFAKDVEPK